MRRISLLVAVFAALAFTSSAAASTLFVVKGKGWGHGIGMSQWGAQGFAQHGWTHQQILAHYYRGTTLGVRTGNVRVLLTSGRARFPLASTQTIWGAGKSLAPGSYSVTRSGSTVLIGGKTFPSGTTFRSAAHLSVDGTRTSGVWWQTNRPPRGIRRPCGLRRTPLARTPSPPEGIAGIP
jgi:hypothetical protein